MTKIHFDLLCKMIDWMIWLCSGKFNEFLRTKNGINHLFHCSWSYIIVPLKWVYAIVVKDFTCESELRIGLTLIVGNRWRDQRSLSLVSLSFSSSCAFLSLKDSFQPSGFMTRQISNRSSLVNSASLKYKLIDRAVVEGNFSNSFLVNSVLASLVNDRIFWRKIVFDNKTEFCANCTLGWLNFARKNFALSGLFCAKWYCAKRTSGVYRIRYQEN